MTEMDARVLASLRCPSCEGAVVVGAERADCTECCAEYVVSRGVPILLHQNNPIFDAQRVAQSQASWTEKRGIRRFIPKITKNLASEANYRVLKELVLQKSSNPLILLVGTGEGGVGLSALSHPHISVVTSDVVIGSLTHVVADGHDLPFVDQTFDAVVVQAVMEHVLDPVRCVSEVHRVLRSNGLVYSETPFMQQVHFGAYDFTRWTALGHRRLFRHFEEIASGIAVGAGSALASSLCYFFASFASTPRGRKIVFTMAKVLFFWLREFDRVQATDAAWDAASGFYFLGRKSATVLSDSELLTGYRGGMRVPSTQ